MYVIEGLDDVAGLPAGSFAIMTKIHHAAIDGVTLLEITSALNDLSPTAPGAGGDPRSGVRSACPARWSRCRGRPSTPPCADAHGPSHRRRRARHRGADAG